MYVDYYCGKWKLTILLFSSDLLTSSSITAATPLGRLKGSLTSSSSVRSQECYSGNLLTVGLASEMKSMLGLTPFLWIPKRIIFIDNNIRATQGSPGCLGALIGNQTPPQCLYNHVYGNVEVTLKQRVPSLVIQCMCLSLDLDLPSRNCCCYPELAFMLVQGFLFFFLKKKISTCMHVHASP